MIPHSLKDINNEALRSLIERQVPEDKTLEYKGRVPGKADSESDGAIKTVCAFANTAGGRLILGMETEDSLPVRLSGIATAEIDERKQWFENKLRDLVEPVIPTIDIQTVEIGNDEHLIVVEVGEGWVGPHRWKKNNHFYRRTSAGNEPLDVGEVRTAFAKSEGVSERIRQFRMERIWRVQSGRTPVVLQGGAHMVLHILPRSAFSTTHRIDISTLEKHDNRIEPIGGSSNHRVNLDGFLTFSTWAPGGECTYTQIFRNGSIEAVTLLGSNEKGPVVGCWEYEEDVIEVTRRYLEVAERHGLHPPYIAFLTFVNAKGMEFIVLTRLTLGRRNEDRIAREDTLMLPEIVIDERDVVAGNALKPLFDSVWNTFGFRESYNYNPEGNWERLRR